MYAPNNSLLTVDTRSSMDRPDTVDNDFEAQVAHMDRMRSEQHRLDSYTTWPLSLSQRPADLARAGLFYTQTGDRVQCPFCHGVLKQWLPHDKPLTEHARQYSQCRFIRGYEVGNIPMSPQFIPDTDAALMGNRTGLDLTLEEDRLITYKHWPQDLRQQPEVLARAGFYYIPCPAKPDRVKCVYCNGKLFNWQVEDDPFMKHVKCFPTCPYIAICLGDDVIGELQNPSQSQTSQNTTQPRCMQSEDQACRKQTFDTSTTSCDTLYVHMRSEPVQAVQAGFPYDLVKQTETCLRERQGNFTSDASSESKVVRNENQAWRQNRDPAVNTKKMREENSRIRDQYLCKVCMKNPVSVPFMPCGHLWTCCGPCSTTMTECPICRAHISENVKQHSGNGENNSLPSLQTCAEPYERLSAPNHKLFISEGEGLEITIRDNGCQSTICSLEVCCTKCAKETDKTN